VDLTDYLSSRFCSVHRSDTVIATMIMKATLDWDGKSTVEIEEVYRLESTKSDFTSTIVALLIQESNQTGASWLLKKYLDNGNSLGGEEITSVYQCLDKLNDWGSKLHLLQCLPNIPVSDSYRELIERFVRNCLADKNKFVRAWAYGGFYLLADHFPEYRSEAVQFIDSAMLNEPASVKARIRNVIKRGFLADSG